MKVINNSILVEEDKSEKKLGGGLVVPKDNTKSFTEGKVIAVGDGTKDEPMKVAVGDKILYGKHAGAEVTIEGKDYRVIEQKFVLAIL